MVINIAILIRLTVSALVTHASVCISLLMLLPSHHPTPSPMKSFPSFKTQGKRPLPHEAVNSCSKPRASLPPLHPQGTENFSSVTFYTSMYFTNKLNGAITPILDFKLYKGRD